MTTPQGFGAAPESPYPRDPVTGMRKCRSRFKGNCCGYEGSATWCDGTMARCCALGNEHNYDRGVPVRTPQDDRREAILRWKLFISGAASLLLTPWVGPTWLQVVTGISGAACVAVPILVPQLGKLLKLRRKS